MIDSTCSGGIEDDSTRDPRTLQPTPGRARGLLAALWGRVGLWVLVWTLILPTESIAQRPPDFDRLMRQCRFVRAAALVDADTGQPLFLFRPDEQLPPASTVKLMLLLLAAEEIEAGRRSPGDSVQVSRRSFRTGGQQLYLAEGDSYTLGTMAVATAVHSANDAAVTLAEGLYGSYERAVAMMNARAAELGLSVTRFFTPHGLPASWGQHEDRSSAWDLADIGREAVRHPVLLEWTGTRRAELPGRGLIMLNSNDLLTDTHGVDGLKTGFTQRAKYCLVATATRGGRRLVCAILGAESSRGRFDLARDLFTYGFERCRREVVLAAGSPVGVRPLGGKRSDVRAGLVAADSLVVWLDPDGAMIPRVHLAVPDTLPGDTESGDPVGEVHVYIGTRLAARVAATVDRDLTPPSAWRRFLEGTTPPIASQDDPRAPG